MSSLKHHPLVELAHASVEAYVRDHIHIQPPAELPQEMQAPAGAFVSLHMRNGELRGCIGTIQPQCGSLAEEVIENAISAATRDPRFPPVRPDELIELEISVDVLTEPAADRFNSRPRSQAARFDRPVETRRVEARPVTPRPRDH